jgi:ubiquinone/menaquinone biosynthesis C-methylase UbiE
MQRTPEPEVMDDDAQARAYAEADFREPHDRFVALLHERLTDLRATGTALDLGCGPGDVTLRVARSLPGWHIDGIDASLAMLRYGRAAVESCGLGGRITLHYGYLPNAALPQASYDLVVSNSLLHHLEDPQTLWRSVLRWTQPGTAVFVMDLHRPESRTVAEDLVERYAAAEPAVLKRDFINSLLAAYRAEEVREQLTGAGLSLEVAEVGNRHLAVWGLRS